MEDAGVKVAIRHIPRQVRREDYTDLLHHFGAQDVWATTAGDVIAVFPNRERAQHTISSLHQLRLGSSRPLSLRFLRSDSSLAKRRSPSPTSVEHANLNKYLEELNGWFPALGFTSPPPPLKYDYPEATPAFALNIANALMNHPPLYVQTLHLMNKMCLDPPFEPLLPEARRTFAYLFSDISVENILPPLPPEPVSEEESEMSTDDETPNVPAEPAALPSKRKSRLKRINKKPKPSILLKPSELKTQTDIKTNPKDVFENANPVETKRIKLNIDKVNLEKHELPEEPVMSEFGTIEPVHSEVNEKSDLISENRLSESDMRILPVFKNYERGRPSLKLYIKNLSKDVLAADLETLYLQFLSEEELKSEKTLEIKLMQEGRMKGQAFVQFPSIASSSLALNETNGYILKGKPMVVQFGRAKV